MSSGHLSSASRMQSRLVSQLLIGALLALYTQISWPWISPDNLLMRGNIIRTREMQQLTTTRHIMLKTGIYIQSIPTVRL
jgi:hypothetical protein